MSGVSVEISNQTHLTYGRFYPGAVDVDGALMKSYLGILAEPPMRRHREDWPKTLRGAMEMVLEGIHIDVLYSKEDDDTKDINMWMPASNFRKMIDQFYASLEDPAFVARHQSVIDTLRGMYEF